MTSAGLPAGFVSAVWKQWRKPGQMHRDRDGIALVTRGRHTGFAATWADIKTWCADSDADFALAKINASAKHKKVFSSARESTSGANTPANDSDTVAMVRALHVIPVDFQLQPSASEQDAITQCRTIIASGKMNDAKNLWQALVLRAEASRISGGTITLEELWAELRSEFSLAEHPDFTASSRVLAALTADYGDRIETGLPNGASFPRKQLLDDLASMVNVTTVTFVYGNSGTGKSALVSSTSPGPVYSRNNGSLKSGRIDLRHS